MPIGRLMIGRLSYFPMSLNSIWLAWMGIHGVGGGLGKHLMHVSRRRWLSMEVGNIMVWGVPDSRGGGLDLLHGRKHECGALHQDS